MHDQTAAQLDHWIIRSRQGDREAFAEIVRQYQSKVSAVTFSMTGNLPCKGNIGDLKQDRDGVTAFSAMGSPPNEKIPLLKTCHNCTVQLIRWTSLTRSGKRLETGGWRPECSESK